KSQEQEQEKSQEQEQEKSQEQEQEKSQEQEQDKGSRLIHSIRERSEQIRATSLELKCEAFEETDNSGTYEDADDESPSALDAIRQETVRDASVESVDTMEGEQPQVSIGNDNTKQTIIIDLYESIATRSDGSHEPGPSSVNSCSRGPYAQQLAIMGQCEGKDAHMSNVIRHQSSLAHKNAAELVAEEDHSVRGGTIDNNMMEDEQMEQSDVGMHDINPNRTTVIDLYEGTETNSEDPAEPAPTSISLNPRVPLAQSFNSHQEQVLPTTEMAPMSRMAPVSPMIPAAQMLATTQRVLSASPAPFSSSPAPFDLSPAPLASSPPPAFRSTPLLPNGRTIIKKGDRKVKNGPGRGRKKSDEFANITVEEGDEVLLAQYGAFAPLKELTPVSLKEKDREDAGDAKTRHIAEAKATMWDRPRFLKKLLAKPKDKQKPVAGGDENGPNLGSDDVDIPSTITTPNRASTTQTEAPRQRKPIRVFSRSFFFANEDEYAFAVSTFDKSKPPSATVPNSKEQAPGLDYGPQGVYPEDGNSDDEDSDYGDIGSSTPQNGEYVGGLMPDRGTMDVTNTGSERGTETPSKSLGHSFQSFNIHIRSSPNSSPVHRELAHDAITGTWKPVGVPNGSFGVAGPRSLEVKEKNAVGSARNKNGGDTIMVHDGGLYIEPRTVNPKPKLTPIDTSLFFPRSCNMPTQPKIQTEKLAFAKETRPDKSLPSAMATYTSRTVPTSPVTLAYGVKAPEYPRGVGVKKGYISPVKRGYGSPRKRGRSLVSENDE
ncbi:hypothetical protein GQ43DRAFT_428916, partial [Delitschia confertaspora ATCC 74209]